MKHIVKSTLLVSALSVMLFSCDKKPNPTPVTPTDTTAKKGEVGIEMHNYAGTEELVLDNTYVTPEGENLLITKYNYYITNIKLKKADGTEYVQANSYYLVMGDKKTSGHFHLKDVPEGDYTSVSFLVGVDSARNTDGAQDGALDPIHGMFWTWNTGYIMAKMEGISPESSQADKSFAIHIGGFKGEYSGIRKVTLTLPQAITVKQSQETTIKIKADAMKWFGPNKIKVATTPNIMNAGPTSKQIADNYTNMFSIGK